MREASRTIRQLMSPAIAPGYIRARPSARRTAAMAYRRVYHILRREGWVVNAKKAYRLYRELGLQLRDRTPKRRVKAKLR